MLCIIYGFDTKLAVLNGSIRGNATDGIHKNVISECLVKRGFIHTLEEYLWYYNNKRISLKLKEISPIQYKTHSQI